MSAEFKPSTFDEDSDGSLSDWSDADSLFDDDNKSRKNDKKAHRKACCREARELLEQMDPDSLNETRAVGRYVNNLAQDDLHNSGNLFDPPSSSSSSMMEQMFESISNEFDKKPKSDSKSSLLTEDALCLLQRIASDTMFHDNARNMVSTAHVRKPMLDMLSTSSIERLKASGIVHDEDLYNEINSDSKCSDTQKCRETVDDSSAASVTYSCESWNISRRDPSVIYPLPMQRTVGDLPAEAQVASASDNADRNNDDLSAHLRHGDTRDESLDELSRHERVMKELEKIVKSPQDIAQSLDTKMTLEPEISNNTLDSDEHTTWPFHDAESTEADTTTPLSLKSDKELQILRKQFMDVIKHTK